ncbi:MAG: LEPR-XLL domain-containing protein, partial [Fibrobacter sp.]|nr:LEPR-XLL domain-containing protein [Fibrobacter sp.]
MSKTNNNSRKNTKTTKNTAKKATRSRISSKKNFKIENLEPRLMMDAAPAAFDVEKLEDYANQFANVADSIANKASEAIGAVTEFDVSNLGIAQNAADFVSMLGDSADQFKSEIVDKVTEILQNAIVTAKAEIEAFNSAVENADNQIEELSLKDFVNTYVKNVLQSSNGTSYKGLNFSAEGSKLVVRIDHTYDKSLSGLGFDFGSLGEIKMDGTSTLSTAAKLQMTVDLNSDNDEYYFEDVSDINVETPVIEKLEARIQNLGLHATFMKMGLVEQNLSEETPDLSLSYNGSDVTTIVDLEFKLENSTGLPFSFAEGDYLKISNSDGNLDVHVPDFQMKGDFSLQTVLENLDFTKIPYLNQLKLNFGGEKISIAQVAQKLNDVWAKTSMALSAAVSKVQSEAGQIQQQFVLNVQTLQQCLEAIAGDKWNELKGYLDGLKIDGHAIIDALNNVANEAINLVEGENTITLFFKPKIGSLDNLNLFSLNLDGLDADFSFAVQLSVNISADGKVSFGIPSIEQFNLGVTRIQLPSGLPIALNGDELSVSLQSGDLVATVPEIEVTGEFSLDAVLAGLRNLDIPLLNKTLFTVGNQSYGALDIVEKVNTYWGLLSGSLYSSVVESGTVANKFMLSMEQLKNHLYDIIGQKKTELDNFIKNIEIIKTDLINTAEAQIKVFDSAVENVANLADKYIDLISGDNTITVFFSPKQLSLNGLNAELFNLEGLDVDTPIAVDIVVTLAEGKISFKEIALREFNVNVSKSIDSSLDVGGVEINLDNGKFDFAASISGDTDNGFSFNKCGAALTYDEISLAVAGTSLVKLDAGEFSYANGEWTLPNEFKNISSIFEGDDFDFGTILNIASNVPYLDNVKFTLPGIGECSLQDVLSKVNDFRTALPYAIAQTAEKVNGVTDVLCRVDAQALHTAFSNILTSNIDGLLETVNLKLSDMDDNSFVNILNSNVAGVFDLKQGTNTFNVVFKPIHTNLDKFSIMGVDLPDVDVNSEIGFSFSVVLDDEGVITSFDVSFDSFKFGIAINESIPEGLPFVIEGNEVSISWNGDEWEYTIPEISLNDDFSLATVLRGISSANLPILDRLKIPVGNKEYSVLEIASKVEKIWSYAPGTIYNCVEQIENAVDQGVAQFKLNLDQLRSSLTSLVSEELTELEAFVQCISVVGNASFMDLVDGENNIALELKLNSGTLKKLGLGLFDLNDVEVGASFVVNFTLAVENGKISFADISLQKFSMDMKKTSVGTISLGGVSATLQGGKFDLSLAIVNDKNHLVVETCDAGLTYSGIELKSGSTALLSLGAGEI